MEKRLNIELSYLKKLVDGLKTLEESQFEYSSFVPDYDEKNQCGTVCCAWGWMPRFVPESGVKWDGSGRMSTHPEYFFKEINHSEVESMFYGYNFEGQDFDKFGNGYDANLQQVINRIEHVISVYEKK